MHNIMDKTDKSKKANIPSAFLHRHDHAPTVVSEFTYQCDKKKIWLSRFADLQWSWAAKMSLVLVIAYINSAQAQTTRSFQCLPSACCDHHEFCFFWGKFGECKKNSVWMSLNCKLTCKMCPTDGMRESAAMHSVATTTEIKAKQRSGVEENTTKRYNENNHEEESTSKLQDKKLKKRKAEDEDISEEESPPAQPKSPAVTAALVNDPAKCTKIRESKSSNVVELMNKGGLISEREDALFVRQSLSTADITNSNSQLGCAPVQASSDCTINSCYHLRYRTLDGTCNNFRNPLFGAAARPFIRHKSPIFDDGIQVAAGMLLQNRPSVRDVSRLLLSSSQMKTAHNYNTLVMQFGQFLVHDISKTSLFNPCSGCTASDTCTPIVADPFDPRFGCSTPPCCVAFTRASGICGTGTSSTLPRTPINENTAFVDGSAIYGSSLTDSDRLRLGAFLQGTMFDNKVFMPFDLASCVDVNNCPASFDAGDNRVTLFVGLSALHTLFLREHNRIATVLQQQNSQWSQDRVFQETRKIVGAELQVITYKEWLPKILGSAFETRVGSYKEYDDQIDASIASEFAHAAMRFGHGMIQENFKRVDEDGDSIPAGSLKFEDGVLKPQRLLFEGGVDPIVRGMMTMPLKRPQHATTTVTEGGFAGTDLVSMNLQRGRDVGLASYNEWREFCGLKRAKMFDDLEGEISDSEVRGKLENIYKDVDIVDLYAATLLEDPVAKGLVGPTPACIIGRQFKRIRDGDRFWYQNPTSFTPAQLAQLEKVTFSRIICDNGDNFSDAPPRGFEFPSGSNDFVSCKSIQSMNLSQWSL